MPEQYGLAEIVGKWVWVTFGEIPSDKIRAGLSQLGFHWNNVRKCWQHPRGQVRERGTQDPREKYGFLDDAALRVDYRSRMGLDREEEVVVLYALHKCGGKGSKARIIYYIIENGLMKSRHGDNEVRENREKKVENDLAWARANLKKQGQLAMPKEGIWQITELGRQRLLRIAQLVYDKPPDPNLFTRYSEKFLKEMTELGQHVATLSSAQAITPLPTSSAPLSAP